MKARSLATPLRVTAQYHAEVKMHTSGSLNGNEVCKDCQGENNSQTRCRVE
jgi:hypothetical protein